MKKIIASILAMFMLALPAAAEEFAMQKAVNMVALGVDANRSVSRGTTWFFSKYTFKNCNEDALNPLMLAFKKDIDNNKVTLAIQRSAPFAYYIEYNQTDTPLMLNSENFDNILLITGQPNLSGKMSQVIVAVVWSTADTAGLVSGEMYIIERDPVFAAENNNFNLPEPQITNDNLLRLNFYCQTYQENYNYRHGTNIVNAVALVVPEIINNGTPDEIETAQNLLAQMIAITPSPATATLGSSWEKELEYCSKTLLNLMQRLSSGSGTSQYQATPNTFVINGAIDPELWDIGYFVYTSGPTLMVNTTTYELIKPTDQTFSYQTELSEVTIGRLQALFKDGSICSAWIQFPFVPGQVANVTVHNGWYTLTGSDFYDDYSACINLSSAKEIYEYAKDHIYQPGAVCAAFMSNKLSRNQLIELYDHITPDCRSSNVGTFLRKYF